MAQDNPDERLVQLAQSGDAGAFRALFLALAPGVRRFLGDLLRDDAAADEATQETFVRAFRRLGTLDDRGRLAPWLFGIARMVFFEQLRARRRELDAQAEPETSAAGPDHALLTAESNRLLDGALAALCPDRRAALLMRVEHGLGYADIAQAMGWPLHKVKNEIHRARLELRARLAHHLEGAA